MSGPASLDNAHVEAAYARWAPVYDLAFAAVMGPGRRALAAVASKPGDLVLDVGVGTGLELPMFAAGTRVVGIDLSDPMLRIAQARVRREGLRDVAGLARMDATRLAFADATFDTAVAPYVLTVVPDPARTLDELLRVVRPGGDVVLVNHIGAARGPIAAIEGLMARYSAGLGWRPTFPWAIVGDWLASRPSARLVERRAIAPLGLFTLIRIARLA